MLHAFPTVSIHCWILIGCICYMHFLQYQFIVQHWSAAYVTCISDSIYSLFNTDWLDMLHTLPTVSINCSTLIGCICYMHFQQLICCICYMHLNNFNSLFITDLLHMLHAFPTVPINSLLHKFAAYVTCISDSIIYWFNTDLLHMLHAFPKVPIHYALLPVYRSYLQPELLMHLWLQALLGYCCTVVSSLSQSVLTQCGRYSTYLVQIFTDQCSSVLSSTLQAVPVQQLNVLSPYYKQLMPFCCTVLRSFCCTVLRSLR